MHSRYPKPSSRPSEERHQIRTELAMLNKEMSRTSNDFYQVWLPFVLGASMALGVFILVSLMRH
ncbi:hypothetical protein NLK61_00915 [Pseudomonas fuscovaginae UPB0736]|uniref:hypothetical protein n=1 Tax=Pseudomonas asplenii TaxID=53407 RepID=UPI00028899BA|nr:MULTISPECIES: hypothetical protein [Pseudomonas]UUQ65242.1 hypothetical protein NLK61_00915 [Pseudomonas fuscovaginae UPB0736]UZE31544.1 hypothetical protein LOY63_12755 [Pseudomonas asplenii]